MFFIFRQPRCHVLPSALRPFHKTLYLKHSSIRLKGGVHQFCFRQALSTFTHRTLDTSRNEIRLIKLKRRRQRILDGESLISCSITHVTLDAPPEYMALSNGWGDPEITRPILIDNALFNVTENLWQALSRLEVEARLPDTLWVDAICINQQDDAEKSTQVQAMRHIYGQAQLVLAWLGPPENYGEFVLERLERVGNHLDGASRMLGLSDNRDPRMFATFHEKVKEINSSFVDDNSDLPLHLMVHIFGRDFWQRAWIVQEIHFAQEIILMYGAKLCLWRTFMWACHVLDGLAVTYPRPSRLGLPIPPSSRNEHLESKSPGFGSIPTRAGGWENPPKKSMCELLLQDISPGRQFQDLISTDPRDMIYALLNLSNDSETLGIRPDYSKTCESVYIQVADAILREGNLGVLSCCQFPKAQPRLPSWTPDWSMPYPRFRIDFMDSSSGTSFQASGSSKSLISTTFGQENHPKLCISGTIVSVIQRKEKGCPFRIRAPTLEEFRTFMEELEDLARIRSDQSSNHINRDEIWRIPIMNREYHEKHYMGSGTYEEPSPAMYESYLALRGYRAPPQGCLDKEEWRVEAGRKYLSMFGTAFWRSPFMTRNGYLGLGPDYLEVGDLVVIFLGARVPHIMREVAGGLYELIGESYVHGIMQGEFMESKPKTQTFVLR